MFYPKHHPFISNARVDDRPKTGGEGSITAFSQPLKDQHRAYAGRELRVFLDRES